MRTLALLVLIGSTLNAGDRVPFRVTCRPVFVPNACLPVEAKPLCVTIDGVDWDLGKIRAEYRTAWTWPGMTEQSLRQHLAKEHRVSRLDKLAFDDLKRIHAVIHEREKAVRPAAVPIRASPAPRQSSCPGGVCPAPNRSRGLFFKWR